MTVEPLPDVPSQFRADLEIIDSALTKSIRDRPGPQLPPNLQRAIEYALLGGGKRLRPVLCISAAKAIALPGTPASSSPRWHAALPAACATEYIHAFSLVHDDLPAMDDDDLRRGRPTVHRKFDEAMAILAGDALQSLAYEILCEESSYSDAKKATLLRELTDASTRMIAGQVYDTLGGMSESLVQREQLELIHRNKTGALIRAACRMGAIAVDADTTSLAAITSYGEAAGLMFQIVDDLLDVTQSAEQIGKAAGKDIDAGKLTFPGLLGVEHSQEEVVRLQSEALAAISPFGKHAQPLIELTNYMAIRTR